MVTIRNAWENVREQSEALEKRQSLVLELETVNELFTQSKNAILSDLYSEIERSFNQYYTTIHPNEQEINLDFDANGTESVEIETNFEGQRDSPLAFHSEGHIDTMGVCLFLALRDRLDASGPDLVLLDDIVMSVDRNHRRGVAKLLRDYLGGNPQGILATHEEAWADQLKEMGAVPNSNEFQISDWDISVGPIMKGGSGNPAWEIIEEYIDNNKPHAAAFHLRRQAEKIGFQGAISLEPAIRFTPDYSLGHYVHGIAGRISGIATGAKRENPDGSEMFETAVDMDNRRSELFGDVGFTEMNSMVHYNQDEWGQLPADELRGVLEKWKAIEDFLYCDECGSMIEFSEQDGWKWIQCPGRHIEVGYED